MEENQIEIWRTIVGYANKYDVSNLGNVRNVKRGRILKQNLDRDGYSRLCLILEGKKKLPASGWE